MYDLFLQNFNEKAPLSAPDTEVIKTYLTPKKLRKKQYLLQEGDVCKYIAFVTKGALRSYTVEENGT
ncbi:MAG: Crp/Fnr family transcriptional regulator, partial [Sphingobacteriaceae bacterium]